MDLLLALDALLKEASVTGAARRACLSQPAMSRALAKLRVSLSDPILVRDRGRWVLTERAEALKEPLDDVLRLSGQLLAPAFFDPKTAQTRFVAVVPDVIAIYLLPLLLDALSAKAPHCSLQLDPWPGRPDRSPDLIITSEIEPFRHLRREPIYEDVDIVAGRPERLNAVDDVLALDHVAVIANGMREDPVDTWLAENGCRRNIRVTVSHYLLALELAASGRVVAVLPTRAVFLAGARHGLAYRDLPVPQSRDRIHMLYPASKASDLGVAWLRSLVSNVVRREILDIADQLGVAGRSR